MLAPKGGLRLANQDIAHTAAIMIAFEKLHDHRQRRLVRFVDLAHEKGGPDAKGAPRAEFAAAPFEVITIF